MSSVLSTPVPRQLFDLVLVHRERLHGNTFREHVLRREQAAQMRYEHVDLSREIPEHVGQENTPGQYWSATKGCLMDYESYTERQWLLQFDFRADVVGMSTQPFRLEADFGDVVLNHYPDIFLRLQDGAGTVVDVKDPSKAARPDVQLQAELTGLACRELGFGYEFVTTPDPFYTRNLEWISTARRPLSLPAGIEDELLAAAAGGTTFGELTDHHPLPEFARVAAYALLWNHRLACDLHQPLRDHTRLWIPDEWSSR